MAVVISPYVGDARGKLGAAVYLRSKGQTLVRGYNPSPLNRRTVSQQGQRAVFSSAVRFYSRGVQNLFQFAFEDKKSKESDYNAFMRYNAKKGMYFGPDENANDAFGALAPWVLTRGSLGSPVPNFDSVPYVPFAGVTSQPASTVGAVSSAIIAADPSYEVGDILTFLGINTWMRPGSNSYPYDSVPEEIPEWTLRQLVLDPSDDTQLSSPDWFVAYSSDIGLELWGGRTFNGSSFASGVAFVHSRVRNGKVFVSNSQLVLNRYGNLVYNYGRSQTWLDLVMAAWGSEQASILQGGIVKRQKELNPDLIQYPFRLPQDIEDVDRASIKINLVVTIDEVVEHLDIKNEESVRYIGFQASVGSSVIEYSAPGSGAIDFSLHYTLTDGATFLWIEAAGDGIIQSIGWT